MSSLEQQLAGSMPGWPATASILDQIAFATQPGVAELANVFVDRGGIVIRHLDETGARGIALGAPWYVSHVRVSC